MDIDKLMSNERITKLDNEVIKKAKERYKDYENDIESIRFLFQNCCYNNNRLKEEFDRSRGGFGKPSQLELEKIVENFKIEKSKTLNIGIPITFWAYIYLFEFHSLLSNLIRCCNFITKFKMELIDDFKPDKSPTISKYCCNFYKRQIKNNKEDLHRYLIKNFNEWIKNVNDIRNDVMHNFIEVSLKGRLLIKVTRTENEILYGGDVELSLPSLKVENIEKYSNECLDNLETFIRQFFIHLI